MVAILFNSAELLEQNDHTPLKKANVTSGENWSEKKLFKDYTILNMYIAQRQDR